MSTSVDTMKNFFNILKLYSNDTTTDGVAILDRAVRATTRFAGLQDAVNNFVSDMANVTATAGATQSLKQNCGIVLGADNDFTADTGAVSGYNAGMGVVKNAKTIVPEPDVKLSELPLPAEGSTNAHSYTGADGKTFYFTTSYPETYITVTDNSTNTNSSLAQSTTLQAEETYMSKPNDNGFYYSASGEQVASAIKTMMRGMENYWVEQGLKLAYDSFDLDFNNKNINVTFGINQGSQAETGPEASDPNFYNTLPASNIGVELNSVMYAIIDPNDPNGNTRVEGGSNQNYLDRTIAHELIHAVMQASGTLKDGMPEFFTEGVAELVQGDDDFDSNDPSDILALAQNSERLTQALAFKAGTGTLDAYTSGHMFLRYLCQQSQPVNVEFGSPTARVFTHTTTQDIISDYKDGDQINVATGVQIADPVAAGDDIFISSNIGTMILRDTRGKVLNFADETGTIYERDFIAKAAGTIDGRIYGEEEVIYGADNLDNQIYAGDGGAKLWGGSYGNDELIGGAGFDEFIGGVGGGNDTIRNAEDNDIINLRATTLEQILNTSINADGVNLSFTDGSNLNVVGNVDATFKLADGSAYVADQSSGQWTKIN